MLVVSWHPWFLSPWSCAVTMTRRTIFVLSIDDGVLLDILSRSIPDKDIMGLAEGVTRSFASTASGKGLPLGNLTSQLFANIYMNEFGQFVKHKFKARYYLRYADDFVFLSEDRRVLGGMLPLIDGFLREKLKLTLHPQKVFIKTFASGVDFLGWVHFTDHRVLRTSTKRWMIKWLKETSSPGTMQSYFGLLRHGNTHGIQEQIAKIDTKPATFPL